MYICKHERSCFLPAVDNKYSFLCYRFYLTDIYLLPLKAIVIFYLYCRFHLARCCLLKSKCICSLLTKPQLSKAGSYEMHKQWCSVPALLPHLLKFLLFGGVMQNLGKLLFGLQLPKFPRQHGLSIFLLSTAMAPNLFHPVDQLGKVGHPLRSCTCVNK